MGSFQGICVKQIFLARQAGFPLWQDSLPGKPLGLDLVVVEVFWYSVRFRPLLIRTEQTCSWTKVKRSSGTP